MKEALLLIDIQNDYFSGGKCELNRPLEALCNTEKILDNFRKENKPIIYVQHINVSANASFFVPNTDGVKIHNEILPIKGDFIVTKHTPSCFYKTNLNKIILENQITHLVVCGMMSHMCVDTTVRACKDYEINVTLIDDACTTKSLIHNGEEIPADVVHKAFMAALNDAFAKVTTAEEYLKKWEFTLASIAMQATKHK